MNEQERLDSLAIDLVEGHYGLLEQLVMMRKKHSLSQEEVGRRMGITQPAVAVLEGHEANPTLSTLRRYALAVDARLIYKVLDDCEVQKAADIAIEQSVILNLAVPGAERVSNFKFLAGSTNYVG